MAPLARHPRSRKLGKLGIWLIGMGERCQAYLKDLGRASHFGGCRRAAVWFPCFHERLDIAVRNLPDSIPALDATCLIERMASGNESVLFTDRLGPFKEQYPMLILLILLSFIVLAIPRFAASGVRDKGSISMFHPCHARRNDLRRNALVLDDPTHGFVPKGHRFRTNGRWRSWDRSRCCRPRST